MFPIGLMFLTCYAIDCLPELVGAPTLCPDILHSELCNQSRTICIRCTSGYVLDLLDNSACVQTCPERRPMVNDENTWVCTQDLEKNGNDAFCEPHCSMCTRGRCVACRKGYKANQGVCEGDLLFELGNSIVSVSDPCPEDRCRSSNGTCVTKEFLNCEVCPGNDVCQKCMTGYCLDSDNTCKHLSELFCKSCPNGGMCTQCPDGYCLDSSNKCVLRGLPGEYVVCRVFEKLRLKF